jgi:hypothetical protein
VRDIDLALRAPRPGPCTQTRTGRSSPAGRDAHGPTPVEGRKKFVQPTETAHQLRGTFSFLPRQAPFRERCNPAVAPPRGRPSGFTDQPAKELAYSSCVFRETVSLDPSALLTWDQAALLFRLCSVIRPGTGRQQDKRHGTAVQVRALPTSLSGGFASSHGRGHRFGICHAQLTKDDPRVDNDAKLIA